MDKRYKDVIEEIVESLENIPAVSGGTSSQEYPEALEEAKDQIGDWLDASIEAAKSDIANAASDDA